VFENGVFWKYLDLREEEINQQLRVVHNNLYCSVNIVTKAKFRKLRCIGGVARVGREIIHCSL
jgi:hypothetical protein